MPDPLVIRDVVLRADLNFTATPWRSVRRMGNLRLVPIALGFLISSFALSFLIDPTALELVYIVGPIVAGFYVFIWVTNAPFLGSMKRGYENSPIGAGPCTFEFDAEGMRQRMPHGETAFRWSAFVDVIESKDSFRFWMTPYSAIALPVRYLNGEQAEALRALVDEARKSGAFQGVR
jgi:hypothetical protein